MTKNERDKLILEALGECEHNFPPISTESPFRCLKCGMLYVLCSRPDFSTPDGFFRVWNGAKEKEWWYEFLEWCLIQIEGVITKYIFSFPIIFINPDRFADAVAEFLEKREEIT